jgi:flagellar hook assembly protein FlgD
MEPGYYNFIWHGEDSYGNSVSSGVYFYKLRTADKLQIKKMMLIK